MKGGLASGADLLKQEESQFVTAEQRANFVPDPKNLELLSKRILWKCYGNINSVNQLTK